MILSGLEFGDRLPFRAEIADESIEGRGENQTEDRDADHSGEHGGAYGLPHLGSGAGGYREGKDAKNERSRSHQYRAKADSSGFRRSLLGGIAIMVLPLPGELHDQDRVLRCQAHQDDEADLSEDVDRHAPEGQTRR